MGREELLLLFLEGADEGKSLQKRPKMEALLKKVCIFGQIFSLIAKLSI
mgnify:CR=1 FL=1